MKVYIAEKIYSDTNTVFHGVFGSLQMAQYACQTEYDATTGIKPASRQWSALPWVQENSTWWTGRLLYEFRIEEHEVIYNPTQFIAQYRFSGG